MAGRGACAHRLAVHSLARALVLLLALALATPTAGRAATRAPAGAATLVNPVGCFPPSAPQAGPAADPDPFRPARPEAAVLNAEGKSLYQRGQFEAARVRYRAALAADPAFLAPALNVACSFVRQERFADATAEVEALVARGYMPWSAEILAAADLGALKVRPEWTRIARALDGARRASAEGLPDDVLFVGRTRKPLGYGDSPSGVFVLGPKQEVFAWSPHTLRTRQLTAEGGRVIALLRSRAHPQAAYVVAEKVVRAGRVSTALRGVTLVILDLRALAPLGHLRLEGDIRRLELAATSAGFSFAIGRTAPRAASSSKAEATQDPPGAAQASPPAERASVVQFEQASWQTHPRGIPRPELTLEPGGVASTAAWRAAGGACPLDVRDAVGPTGVRAVEIRPQDNRSRIFRVGGPAGASLAGLPLAADTDVR